MTVQHEHAAPSLSSVSLAMFVLVQLHAAYSGSITMQGYLLKHRPVTQFMGLFAQEWEMR